MCRAVQRFAYVPHYFSSQWCQSKSDTRAKPCMPQHTEESCCVFGYLWRIERNGSLVISVGFRNRLWSDRPGNCRMIPESDRNIYILYLVQNCSGVHPDSDAMRAGRGGRGIKWPTCEADHTLSTKDIDKNRWLCISASHTYPCMVINWRCGKRDVYVITRSKVTTMQVRTARVKCYELIGGDVKEQGHCYDLFYTEILDPVGCYLV
jgi:hypothetical protein